MYGQSPTTIQIWIYGDVTITTSGSLMYTAVRVKGRYRDSVRSGEHEVVFCITHAQPIASKLNYMGRGRVVYWAARTGKSTANGPRAEKMLPALGLGVLQTDGESRFSLGTASRIHIHRASGPLEGSPRSRTST